MSNTKCDRVKCVHNKMCNYLFELFNAQYTNVIDCNSYEEQRPLGEWIRFEAGRYTKFYKCSLCGRIINTYKENPCDEYPFCHCGAEMRGGKE